MPAARSSAAQESAEILVIEDDQALREGLAMNFKLQGYRVSKASNGEDGLRMAFDQDPDLIVLDLMLPGCSGHEILRELRSHGNEVPILILSARETLDDKIEGLQLGADDYVTKPFDLRELLARVEGMLRRRRLSRPGESEISFGQVRIMIHQRRVYFRGELVELSSKEFDLLCLLAESPGHAVSRDTILDRVWGWGFNGTTRTVDNFVLSLRRKLEEDPAHPKHILTVRQVGYRLDT